jgi:hypothetical protein
MHQSPENAGALFQVASQFNLLEMVSMGLVNWGRKWTRVLFCPRWLECFVSVLFLRLSLALGMFQSRRHQVTFCLCTNSRLITAGPIANKAAKRNMIAWGFATLVPDENVRRIYCRAFALWRNETRRLSLMSALRVNSETEKQKDRPEAVFL